MLPDTLLSTSDLNSDYQNDLIGGPPSLSVFVAYHGRLFLCLIGLIIPLFPIVIFALAAFQSIFPNFVLELWLRRHLAIIPYDFDFLCDSGCYLVRNLSLVGFHIFDFDL